MSFELIFDIMNEENYVLAGRSLEGWTRENLLPLLNSEENALLKIEKYNPFLTAEYVLNLLRQMRTEHINKLIFDIGELVINDVGRKIDFTSFETTAVTKENVLLYERELYKKIALFWQNKGVRILSAETVFIDCDVQLEECTIYPFSILKGGSVVRKNAELIGANYIENSIIDMGATIKSSYITDSVVGKNTTVGPFAHIRQNSNIGNNVRVGDFVEIKKSTLCDCVKTAHLAYVGDANVGENTNIGCGVVFANYDGKQKYSTSVGKNVFIGCNTNLVAPLNLGDDTFIAAGSTITASTPPNTFAIARARQTNKRKKE